MPAKNDKSTPDNRRTYDDALKAEALRQASASRSTQAAAQQLGISRQQAQLVAEVGSVEVARAPEVRQLRAQLKRAEQSMSRQGNCYDNAHAESFWSRLKTELSDGAASAT